MRILQIVPAYYPAVRYGGPIKSVHGLSAALAKRGHEVHIYASNMDGPNDLEVPLDKPVTIDNVFVHYFPVSWLRRLCWCPALNTRLTNTISSFDIVHLQSVFLLPTLAGARAAQSAGIPYILSPRGMLGREVIRRKSRWVKMGWIHFIERKTLRNARAVHVTTELEGEEITSLGLETQTIRCIPNGLDIPAEHSTIAVGPYADLSKPYALFLSRINWKKGLDRLLRCWKHVPNIQLVIGGNDEGNHRSKMETLTRSEGIHDRVRFIGAVADEHKWSLYQNASMFILPSYSENFGNVVAEAMAMSCPVIVTPEVGLAKLVKEADAGIVVDGAPERLAAAIRSLLDDPAKGREMGRRGRETVETRLSWNAVAAQMEKIYSAAIDYSTLNAEIIPPPVAQQSERPDEISALQD